MPLIQIQHYLFKDRPPRAAIEWQDYAKKTYKDLMRGRPNAQTARMRKKSKSIPINFMVDELGPGIFISKGSIANILHFLPLDNYEKKVKLF